MDTLTKVYDTMLQNRLKLWCDVDKCQASAQKNRGCMEQIMSLRLLCDYGRYKRIKLYVLFIDFSKAYDQVPRWKLVERLVALGCERVMLRANRLMYRCTKNFLKSAIIDASIGVRQRALSSCLLFVIYVNHMVRMLKRIVPTDGFLGSLHSLLLMDDTVILALSRKMCEKKLSVVCQFCEESGMKVNENKTNFFVINGEDCDRCCLLNEGLRVSYTLEYLYLGAWFTDSGRSEEVVTRRETTSEAVVNKFSIFSASNILMPFIYKNMVFDAAVTSSLLYSAESWLTNRTKSIEKRYNKLVKCLLGVRKTRV